MLVHRDDQIQPPPASRPSRWRVADACRAAPLPPRRSGGNAACARRAASREPAWGTCGPGRAAARLRFPACGSCLLDAPMDMGTVGRPCSALPRGLHSLMAKQIGRGSPSVGRHMSGLEFQKGKAKRLFSNFQVSPKSSALQRLHERPGTGGGGGAALDTNRCSSSEREPSSGVWGFSRLAPVVKTPFDFRGR